MSETQNAAACREAGPRRSAAAKVVAVKHPTTPTLQKSPGYSVPNSHHRASAPSPPWHMEPQQIF